MLLWGQVLAMFNQKTPLLIGEYIQTLSVLHDVLTSTLIASPAIVVFEAGSLIAALAHNFVTLIVGRAVAGIGGSAVIVAVISISSVVIELKRRPIFFG